MLNYLLKIINWLIIPFNKGLHFFILALLASSMTEVIGFTMFESFPKGIFIALHHYIICYILTLLIYSFKGINRKILKAIVGVLLGINFLIDLVCIFSFHFTFDQEVPAIILGTNSNEAIEFIHMFLPPSLWLLLASGVFGIICVYIILKHWNIQISRKMQNISTGMVFLFFAIICGMKSKNWGNVSITKVITFAKASSPLDLAKYQTDPNIQTVTKKQPSYVIMIIGESFTKSHSSLYGYNQQTNPKLDSIRHIGQLHIFNQIEAPGLNTIPAFKCIMSTFTSEMTSAKWYECLTLPHILHTAKYHTSWFSNQSQKGFYDNIISKYASLFNKSIFLGNRYAGLKKKDLDGNLIHTVKNELTKASPADSLQFHVIHLMGSHHDFKLRYPKSYEHFKAEDYSQFPENQRQTLAEYDNSILYNDYVVSELMKLYADKEAIVFYFSDHGLDVFNSRNDFVGHARHNDPKSVEAGLQIPFMVYLTPAYRQTFPDMSKRVEQAVNKPFCTQNMIYTIMDVIGVEFKNNDAVQQRSLFAQ